MVGTLYNNIEIVRFVNTPIPSNAYLLVDNKNHSCIIVDPGSKEQKDIHDYLLTHNLSLEYIILTHEHFDHCWGVNYLRNSFPTKVVATRQCAEWVKIPKKYFNQLYFDSDESFFIDSVDLLAEDIGWSIYWGGVDIRLLDAKGHSNRGMIINIDDSLFTGDTILFKTRPILKTKYGASIEELFETIKKVYSTYDDQTIVYPGHGNVFRLGETKSYYEDYFRANDLIL